MPGLQTMCLLTSLYFAKGSNQCVLIAHYRKGRYFNTGKEDTLSVEFFTVIRNSYLLEHLREN